MGNVPSNELPPVLISSRMSSQRLPGKALLPLAGMTVLGRTVEAVSESRLEPWVVTSTAPADDDIARSCDREGVAVIRGPLEDLARRLLEAADQLEASWFVRISGDSPLIDPQLIDHAWRAAQEAGGAWDVITNVYPRTFPKGQSVELIRTTALRRAYDAAGPESTMREHVTTDFYAEGSKFRVIAFTTADVVEANDSTSAGFTMGDYSSVQLSIDTQEDLDVAGCVIARLDQPSWEAGWRQCVDIAERCRQTLRPKSRR